MTPLSCRLLLTIFTLFITTANSGAINYPPDYKKSPGSPIFEFHSGFWINLHHFLYHQALLRTPGNKADSSELADTLALNAAGLTQKQQWIAAINYYKSNLVNRDLLLDTGMVKIKDALEDEENAPVLKGAFFPAELETVLNNVSDSYRTFFWAKQNQSNELWISNVKPFIEKYGDTLVGELEKVYLTKWPKGAIRVDVTNYASWAGAYTTFPPNRITVSSIDPHNQQLAALEIIFHEASHTLINKIRVRISEICKQDDKHLPKRDLWHAILFYTTGEVIRDHFAKYIPFAYQTGLWDRAWPMYKHYLQKDWLPYIKGEASFDEALQQLVRDVEVPAK